jgi:hypothetical protein
MWIQSVDPYILHRIAGKLGTTSAQKKLFFNLRWKATLLMQRDLRPKTVTRPRPIL